MYNEFFGFSEKPFEDIPDPKFFYLTPHHRDLLDSVIRGIKDRNEFISVTGAAGTGKTALFYYLLTILEKKIKGVFISSPLTHFRELTKNILMALAPEVSHEGKADSFDHLIHCLNQMRDRDEQLVLIVDEAQYLSKEMIEQLQLVVHRAPKPVPIIFIGQPGFENKLNAPELRWLKRKISLRFQVEPLSEAESSEYIDHRLRLVGGNILKLFSYEAISLIYRYAQGSPLSLNILCDNALRVGYTLSRKRIDVDIVQKVIDELEGPGLQTAPIHSIQQPQRTRLLPLRLNMSLKMISLIIMVLVGLGGVALFVHEGFRQKSIKWGSLETLKRSTAESLVSEPKPSSSGSIKSPFPPPPSLALQRKGDQFMDIVTITAGQTLSFLSQKYYRMSHTTLIDIILDFNPDITNAHLILVNQEIRIPRITEDLFIIPSSDNTYKIYVGTFPTPDLPKIYRDDSFLAGKEVEMLPRKVSEQETWHRMVIGKFEHKEDALEAIRLLQKRGFFPFLRKGP